ncbi:retinol dehydrogenase 13-like [Epargyreus clarus]|uniref:retinol dehydrogenase 13-like n=1 Tax=Epargyreus clarus TaxID=520877 RepID=UPI003C2F516B
MCDSIVRMEGKVAIVTGGSSGMGYETAKTLARRGARVIIASRNETKLIRARDTIIQKTGNPYVSYRLIDLASLKSVRTFANEVVTWEPQIDVLINNAGAVALADRLTDDGLNLTMQVNYFGTFLLTYLLLPLLKASAPSRIINGSAASMYVGHIDFDHWNDIGRFGTIEVLANSKLAATLFTAELDRRLRGTGVTANSFDPFVVKDTDILNNLPELMRNITQLFINMIGQPKEEVAKQLAFLASNPDLENVSGMHYKFCRKWINHWLAGDSKLTVDLWEASKSAVGITTEEDWEANTL